MENANHEYAIEMDHISKRFAGIIANNDITIHLKKGEILALLGENGAGKSTLMSILFGLYTPDVGEIKINGEKVKITNPNDANAYHIGMVHQHFKLVDNYTILQNIILGHEPHKTVFKVIDYKKAREKIDGIIKKYNFNVDLDKKIEDCSVEMQQKTEIIKMLYRDNDILIFDEPTAVLTEQEINEFLNMLLNLKAEGKSIIFITHKLNEIKAVADRVSIIRKGCYIGTVVTKDTSAEELASMMVGRKVDVVLNKGLTKFGPETFRVENLMMKLPHTHKYIFQNVSFNIRAGEIVCVAGIDGNGQQELIYGITGLQNIDDGKIILEGQDITNYSIRKKNKSGLAHIPADRHKYGLVLDTQLKFNTILNRYYEPEFSKLGFLKFKEIKDYTNRLIEEFDIRSGEGANSITRGMSGGNQQKAIIAREIDKHTNFLIAVQPTRGLDVGAIAQVHKTLLSLKDKGVAILLVSLELDEVYALSDRILVIADGQIVGQFKPKEISRNDLGLYMSGAKKDEVNCILNESGEVPLSKIAATTIVKINKASTLKAKIKATTMKTASKIHAINKKIDNKKNKNNNKKNGGK